MALIFPGQGSQYVGMGRDLYEKYEHAREIFDSADQSLGFKISEICFQGPQEVLKQTAITQPAILTVSVVCWQLLRRQGIEPDYVLGHSLGEYSALVAAGALEFQDAVKLVHKRGSLMEQAVPEGKGSMAAVLGLDREILDAVCREVAGIAEPVNYNCPSQIVIAGEKEAVAKAGEIARQKGAKKIVPLTVSGPFHSSLMRQAALQLKPLLEQTTINSPGFPVVGNASAKYLSQVQDIREGLIKQVDHPVLWQESIERLAADGVSTFIELGPGKVLSGLVKKINRHSTILNIEDQDSLQKTLVSLKGGD